MLSQVDQSRLPFFRIGMQLGRQHGAFNLLLHLLTKRFGPLSNSIQQQLQNANLEQLEQWSDQLLDTVTIEELFLDS